MKKSTVVFGATGLVGEALVNKLLQNNDYERIIVVVRRNLIMNNPKIRQVILADFMNIERLKAQLEADDYFCCIGTTIKTAGSQEAFRLVDLNIPVSIARLAEDLKITNFVVISSVGANAKSGNFYLRTKGEMEAAVKKAYSGNLKFIRPSLLIGNRKENRPAEKISVIFMKILGWMFIGPAKKYKGIRVEDVAEKMIQATSYPPSVLVI